MDQEQINKLLDELYVLQLSQEERKLNEVEGKRYMELVNLLRNNNIDIHFGVEY